MISYYNTIEEIDKKCDTAILPVGSVEQHGSHLPTGTDYFIVKALSEKVAERIDAYLLPPLPFSTCYEHTGKQGSVCMSPEIFMNVLKDLIINLYEQGYKRVIVMLGHGGIFAAGPVIREINSHYDDLQVIKVGPVNSAKIKALLTGDPDNEIHAGEKETSLILELHEETVNKERMMKNDFIPKVPREYLNYSSLLEFSDTGVWGKPSCASKEKGKKILDAMIEEVLNYIDDAFSHTKVKKW